MHNATFKVVDITSTANDLLIAVIITAVMQTDFPCLTLLVSERAD